MNKVVYIGYSDVMMRHLLESELFDLIMVIGKEGRMNKNQYQMIEENHIPYYELINKEDLKKIKFPGEEFTVIIYKFEYIIPKPMIENFRFINFHGGSLKYNRGAHAPVWSILNQDKTSCMSMYELTGGVDEGLLIAEYPVDITNEDDINTLNEKLASGIPQLLVSLNNYLRGDINGVLVKNGVYHPKIREKDFTIDIGSDSVRVISAKIRSQMSYYGALIIDKGGRYRVDNFSVLPSMGYIQRFFDGEMLIVDDGQEFISCNVRHEKIWRGGVTLFPMWRKGMVIDQKRKTKEIRKLLYEFRPSLYNSWISDDEIEKLAAKYSEKAIILLLCMNGSNAGIMIMYVNNVSLKKAFVSMIAAKEEFRRMAVGTTLLKRAESIARIWGMKYMNLEVAKQNQPAVDFYLRNGYVGREELESSFIMQKKLNGNINMYIDRHEWL